MKRILIYLAILLFIIPSVSLANDTNSNVIAQNQVELPDIELSNIIKSFEFEENKIIEMDSVYFDNLILVEDEAFDNTINSTLLFKTVTLTNSKPEFPSELFYSEYHNGFWYEGNLHFRSSVKNSNGKYVATYCGFLVVQNK